MVKKLTLALAIAVVAQISWAQSIVSNDVSLVEANLSRFALRSVNNPISLKIKNNGNSTVNTLKINWNDGIEDHIATVRTDIPAGETAVITHPVAVNYSTVVEKNITVSVDMVNDSKDFNAADNSQTVAFNTVSRKGKRGVVAEEGTGTWCTYCTMGIAGFDYMSEKYPENFIGIAVHTGRDPMAMRNYAKKLNLKGVPTYNMDRAKKRLGFDNKRSAESPFKQRMKIPVPADLGAAAKLSGSKLSIDASANFLTDYSNASLRLSVVILEDGVNNASRSYNQSNFYSGSSEDVGGYEKKPNPVPGRDMYYNHVARAILGTYEGQSGSVPSTVKSGDVAKYNFTYSIPSEINKDKIKIVVMLLNAKSGEILNANEIPIDQALSLEDMPSIALTKMYPNPVKDNLTIAFNAENRDYSITVTDMLGRVFSKNEFKNLSGKQNIQLPTSKLSAGNYLVSIASGKASYSKMIIVE